MSLSTVKNAVITTAAVLAVLYVMGMVPVAKDIKAKALAS